MTTPTNEELMTQLGVTAQQAAELVEYFEQKKIEDAEQYNDDTLGGEGIGVGRIIATGYASESTKARFIVGIKRRQIPANLNIFGTFSIHDALGDLVASGSGKLPILNSSSSNSMLVLTVEGLSGMTQGEPLTLRTDTTSSRIEY
ncbi:MAG: hypothetical protein ACKVI8_07170 [Paraglaciecola sp.]